jgi:hypothetical protein
MQKQTTTTTEGSEQGGDRELQSSMEHAKLPIKKIHRGNLGQKWISQSKRICMSCFKIHNQLCLLCVAPGEAPVNTSVASSRVDG